MATESDPKPVEDTAEPGITIPASWVRWLIPLLAGLVVGGGGATGITTALHPSEAASPATSSGAPAMSTEEAGAMFRALEDSHGDLATKDDVEDVLFIVCQLAAAAEPPIPHRRCVQR